MMNTPLSRAALAIAIATGSAVAQVEFASRGTRTFEPTDGFRFVDVDVTLRTAAFTGGTVEVVVDAASSSVTLGPAADCVLVDGTGLPIAAVTLTFPSGSPAGTTQSVRVQVNGDALAAVVEPVEVLQLRLASPVGLVLGDQRAHALMVHDVDDLDFGVDLLGSAGGAGSLVLVDKNTGVTRRRSAAGMRGVADLQAIAVNPLNGQFLGIANDGFRFRAPPGIQFTVDGMRSSELVSLNPETGDATHLFGLGARGIRSLTWDPFGSRLLVCDGEHGTFYRVDPTGATPPALLGNSLFLRFEGITVAPPLLTTDPTAAIFAVRDRFLFPGTVPPIPPAPASLIEVDYGFNQSDIELLWFSSISGSVGGAPGRVTAIAHNPAADDFYVSVFTNTFEWQIWAYNRAAIPLGGPDYVAPAAISPTLPNAITGLQFDGATGTLYATEAGTNTMVILDPTTWAITRPQGGTATVDDVRGMALAGDQLYAVDNGRGGLLRVDRAVGLTTPVGSTGFLLPDFGSTGVVGDEVMEGLAYDDSTDTLFGLARDGAFAVATRIDPSTGIATIASPLSPNDFRSLAFVPATPLSPVGPSLYATAVSFGPAADELWRFDLTSATWSLVGSLQDSANTTYAGVLGMSFDSALASLRAVASFGTEAVLLTIPVAGGPSATVAIATPTGAEFTEALASDVGGMWAENVHGHLLFVDSATGDAQSIGSYGYGLDGRRGIVALANLDGTIYGIDRSGDGGDLLVIVDRATGESRTVGHSRLSVPMMGPIDGSIDCLTVIGGVLYGVHNSGTPGSWVKRLVTIDPATGTPAVVASISGMSGFERVTGLAWDGTMLFAISSGDFFGTVPNYFAQLWTVDPATGIASFVITDFPAASGTLLHSNGGLAFDGTDLYASVEIALPGDPILDQLIRIDTSTAAGGFAAAEVVGRPSHSLMYALAFFDTRTCFPFVRGDANLDGSLNVADATYILAALFGTGSLASMDAADVNDSGAVDLADAVYLLTYLFSGGPQPPAPFPDPGSDPTPDTLGC